MPTVSTIGAAAHTSLANNLTLPLPASLVTGNILIGHIMTFFGGFRFIWPAGWTEVDFTDPSNMSISYAWYRVAARNAAPNVLLSPASGESIQGQLIQISGPALTTPIGNFNKLVNNSGGPNNMIGGSLTTAGINSLVIDLEDSPIGTPATPSGYSAVSGPNNGMLYSSVAMASPGVTPAISYAVGSNINADFQVEILAGPIPATTAQGYHVGG
jgi:hypothetical protein